MALTRNQKILTRVGAGVVLIGGGIWAAIYFINRAKRARAGEGEGGEAPVSPCVARPTSAECIEEKKKAVEAVGGRGNGVPPAGIGAVGQVIVSPAIAKAAFCNKIEGMTRSEVLKALGKTTATAIVTTSLLKVQLRLKVGC